MHRTERVKKGFPKYFLQIHCFQKSTAVNNMIVGANQWTGFYMITASVMKEFRKQIMFIRHDVKRIPSYRKKEIKLTASIIIDK